MVNNGYWPSEFGLGILSKEHAIPSEYSVLMNTAMRVSFIIGQVRCTRPRAIPLAMIP